MLFHLPQPTLIFCGPAVWMGMIQAPAVYLNQRILSTLFLPKKLHYQNFVSTQASGQLLPGT
jgi:hypothetical protein